MSHALRLFVLAAIMAVVPASASEFTILREEIAAARQALVTMILYRDKRGPEQLSIVKVSADTVSLRLGRLKAPGLARRPNSRS